MKIISGILAFKNGKVLLVKPRRGIPRKKWIWGGGHAEKGETPMQAALREFREETGLNAKIKGILAYREVRDTLFIAFLGEALEGELKWPEDEVEEVRWFEINKVLKMKVFRNHELPTDEEGTVEIVREAIENYTTGKFLPL